MPNGPAFPGVYVQEVASGARTIKGVETSTTAFVGYTLAGMPDKALAIDSFAEFEREFGALDRASPVSYAVCQFFLNGGRRAIIVRVDIDGVSSRKDALKGLAPTTGINALLDVDVFNLLCIPETSYLSDADAAEVADAAIRLCEARHAFYLVDAPATKGLADIVAWTDTLAKSGNAAIYFPGLHLSDPTLSNRRLSIPPSGSVAGVFARTDARHGVWKAPAGMEATLLGVIEPAIVLGDAENGVINSQRINALRRFPTHGLVVWGSRTLKGSDSQAEEFKYVPVRRLALYLEESLRRGTQWVVFEPNDEALWARIRMEVGAFMHGVFRDGALQGVSPSEAYFVRCDEGTTTQADIDRGIVNILVGFAPLRRAEFVLLKIQQMAGQVPG